MKFFALTLLVVSCSNVQAENPLKTWNGLRHSLELRKGGKVFSYGQNTHGQLGNNAGQTAKAAAQVDLGGGEAIDISGGQEHSVVLFKDGTVKCWGGNLYGQLGLGQSSGLGFSPDEMGKNLPTVSLGTKEIAIALTGGADHTCVALKSGGVKCWGHNDDQQLGLADRNNRGFTSKDMGDNLKRVDLIGRKMVDRLISQADTDATCAHLQKENTWTCWGKEADAKKLAMVVSPPKK
ncbi:MAG: hypothetical protein HYR96_12385 [Deltaproteobacteria bacterium]|nr:hypothetical protein [Deltaproteobacteria bacterium]MBI3296004.1 hypothetical protein [Deltaproteobacteria bacterium]